MAAARCCPAGHEVASGASRPRVCRVCRKDMIVAVVAAACPELSADDIAAGVDATTATAAAARDLAVALSEGPGVLAGGAPSVVARLVGELRARGSALPEPSCAHCARRGLGLIRVGTIGLCNRCRAHQLAEACSACERRRVVIARDSQGRPLCFACAPRPARLCGRCGRIRPISRRAKDGQADICNSCFRPPVATCSGCGKPKPCHFAGSDRPICASCSSWRSLACSHCGECRPAQAHWPEGPVCESCYRAGLRRRGCCTDCGRDRRLIDPAGPLAQRCADCAGLPGPGRVCADCGIEDLTYHDSRCVRCCLSRRTSHLLASADRTVAAHLVPVRDAIIAAPKPYTALNWLRSAVAAQMLGQIASGALPLDHEALDAHPRRQAAKFLRHLLVAHGALAARDEALIALEAWVADQLHRVDDPSQRRLLRSYATWRVLRRARARAASNPRPRTATRYAKTNLLAPIAFLAWLSRRGVELGEIGQADIDAWTVEGGSSAHELTDFLDWATGRKLLAPVVLTGRRHQPGTTMNPDTRWEIVDRLLHDDHLALTDRVAGCLVLLYAQQLTRIVALSVDQVVTVDDGVYLKLGASQTIIPEPLGALVVDLATNGRSHTGVGSPAHSHWLFPGLHPGRPLDPSGLGQRLRRLGIPTMPARRAALMHLAGQLPAAVLAEILHLQPTTAVHWVAAAGGDWNNYAAEVSRHR
jgi:hypothetical protein